MSTKRLLTLLLLFVGGYAMGQDGHPASGQGNSFGLTLQINNPSRDDIHVNWYNTDRESIDNLNLRHLSYSFGIMGQYWLKQASCLRLRLGRTSIWIDKHHDYRVLGNGVRLMKQSGVEKQVKIHVAPGVSWKIRENRIEFIGGFEIPLNLHGPFTLHHTSRDSLLAAYGMVTETYETTTLPRGISVGVAALTGFNFYPAPRLSVGAEFSPSLLYAKLSGKTTTEFGTVQKSVLFEPKESTGPPTHTEDANRGFSFYDYRFTINVTLWFGKQ